MGFEDVVVDGGGKDGFLSNRKIIFKLNLPRGGLFCFVLHFENSPSPLKIPSLLKNFLKNVL